MSEVDKLIESGLLELYVMGQASPEEVLEVERMRALHTSVQQEIELITESLAVLAESKTQAPNETVKALLMATIDYKERLRNGEERVFLSELNQHSRSDEYAIWLNRKDFSITPVDNIELRLIGYTPKIITGILWVKYETPYEVHDNEIEKFLILEGTCDIITDEKTYSLVPGDYFSIPLHVGHRVKVTSDIPCKAILQRVAA